MKEHGDGDFSTVPPFVSDLRELLLQDRLTDVTSPDIVVEATQVICTAILHGTLLTVWPGIAYKVLYTLVHSDFGMSILVALENRGSVMTEFASQVTNRSVGFGYFSAAEFLNATFHSEPLDTETHILALNVLIPAALDIPSIRAYLSKPSGIPLAFHNLDTLATILEALTPADDVNRETIWDQMDDWWSLIEDASKSAWGTEMLLELGIATFLARMKSVIFALGTLHERTHIVVS